MIRQAKQAETLALFELSKEYDTASTEAGKYQSKIDKLNKAMQNEAKASAFYTNALGISLDDLADSELNEQTIKQELIETGKFSNNQIESFISTLKNYKIQQSEVTQAQIDSADALNTMHLFVSDLTQAYIKDKDSVDLLLEKYPDLRQEVEASAKAYLKAQEVKEKEVALAKELSEKYSDLTGMTQTQREEMAKSLKEKLTYLHSDEAIALTTDLINKLLGINTEATKENTDAIEYKIKALEDELSAFNDSTKAKSDAYKDLNSYYQSDKEAFISSIQEQSEAYLQAGVDRVDVAKWVNDKLTEYAQTQANEEKATLEEKKEAWLSYGENIANSIGSTWGYINDIQENQNDAELTRLQGLVDATEEGSEARETAEQNLLDAKNEFAKEEAKRDKAQASFNAVIDTASAVIGLLANPGGLLGVGLSAGAIATGAAQLGAINSAEVPSYAVGTMDLPYDQVSQLHKGETVLTAGITEEAKTQGITIEPKNKSNDSSGMTQLNIYLGSKLITSEILDTINKGNSGYINKRIVK